MARGTELEFYNRPLRRLLVLLFTILLVLLVLFWRIDNQRAEQIRARILDRIIPNIEWTLVPITTAVRMFEDFQGYARVYEQNQELRRELQAMRAWRETAIQLGQENARLLDLNQVILSPNLTYISGAVLADSGSPFRRSVLLNIGYDVGVKDGWAAMDGLGLVGRISGVGAKISRVMLVTDPNSQIPITIQPSGARAILSGDASEEPIIDFLENVNALNVGDRVVTSGDGGVFPSDLLVGQVMQGSDRRWRVRLSAEINRLEFLRILRARPLEVIDGPGELVGLPYNSGFSEIYDEIIPE